MSGGAPDDEYTYDLAVPRRPDEDDLGGTQIQDKAGSPPQKGQDVYAGLVNEHGRNLAGLNRLTPIARLWIDYDGADYNVVGLDAMATSDKITEDNFTPTSGSAGIVNIAWTAGDLPALQRTPHAWTTEDFGFAFGAQTGANSIQVQIADTSGTLADLSFAVEIF